MGRERGGKKEVKTRENKNLLTNEAKKPAVDDIEIVPVYHFLKSGAAGLVGFWPQPFSPLLSSPTKNPFSTTRNIGKERKN